MAISGEDAQVKKMALPDQMSWIIEEISRLANKQGVKISQIRPERKSTGAKSSKESIKQKNYSLVMFDLELLAGYHQLRKFLAALENHPILMEIEELEIKRGSKDPFEHKVKLELKTYFSL